LKKIGLIFGILLIGLLLFGCTSPMAPATPATNSPLVPSSSPPVQTTATKAAWKTATPWSITDWSRTGDTMQFVLKNESPQVMDFKSITLGAGITSTQSQLGVTPAASITITVTGLGNCVSGGNYLFLKKDIRIKYDAGGIQDKEQAAFSDIVGSCK